MSDPGISINVLKDLDSKSALVKMLQGEIGTEFPMLGTLTQYADKPISEAAKSNAQANFSPTKACSWKLPNKIAFALTPTAKCRITISPGSESFDVAMNVESSSSTQKVSAKPIDGSVYVNVDLDFSIQGTVSATASAGTIGISGKVSGSQAASLSFCLPVAGTLPTPDAIRQAFESFVFPLDPSCLGELQTGAFIKVAFDANLSCELDVTYGLGNYKVAAPDLTSVQQSIRKLVDLTPPSTSIDVGVKGTISYTHAGNFALIVNKTGDSTAKVYLTRSSEEDVDGTVGVTAAITTCDPKVSVDPTVLSAITQDITRNSTITQQVSSAASSGANDLLNGLNGKLASWAKDTSGNVGLTLGLSRQKGHVALFVYDVDLAQADVSDGWEQLAGGTVSQALAQKGFALEPGSGVSDSLTRAATLKFQFFNLFAFSSTSDFFNNSHTELGKDGSIQIVHQLGKEQEADVNKKQRKIRFYFEATATQSPTSLSISNARVDLCMELSEAGISKYGATLANVIGFLPGGVATNGAQEQMMTFVHGKPSGTLDLKFTLKQSAYGKISASPFNGKTPPPLPQQQDADNWQAFQSATESLVSDVPFVDNLTYGVWKTFNVDSIDQVGSDKTPDRRQTGDPADVPSSYLSRYGEPRLVGYFLGASQFFMNLCDDLRILAAGLPDVQNSEEWSNILTTLKKVISDNDYLDYGLPMCAALLLQCSENGVQTSASLTPSSGNSLTCLVTVA
jgi:hypothetical protein